MGKASRQPVHFEATFLVLYGLLITISMTTALTDNRCFLETGSSSETFFVSESTSVGSTIGELRIHGDPRPSGTIRLRLKERDGPVEVAPGTKNLTLRSRLDKEGVDGPSSVFVNLVCERVGASDPGFLVPINVRVTDANDNAPVFVNAPYVLNISEVTVVGTRVLQGVHAVDADQQGPYSIVEYSVLPGPHSEYFEFENELEGTLVLRRPLDYETLRGFDVRISAKDHGEPPMHSETVLRVNVIDADDQNPRFSDERYTATLPTRPRRGAVLSVKPRDIRAFDQDVGIDSPVYYTFNEIGPLYDLFRLHRSTGRLSLARDLSDDDLPHPATLVVRATQQDNADRYALATLTVSRNDTTNSIRFLHGVFHVRASEALPPGALVASLTNNRPGEALKYFVSNQEVLKVFALNSRGELTLRRRLDYEETPGYYFKVFATDGVTNDSCAVNVTVEDVNEWEPRFRYPRYEFFVVGQMNELIGKIEAADGDRDARPTLSISGPNSTLFFITQDGELRLRDRGVGAHVGTATLTVTASDGGTPPRTASVPVTVHFPGGGAAHPRRDSDDGAALLLAGLGAVLLALLLVVALLVGYICKVKRRSGRDDEDLREAAPPTKRPTTANPVFGEAKSKLPSPKVHPAPQPPTWPPQMGGSSRVKKLSWVDDKTDSDSATNNGVSEPAPRLTDNSNLTVYF